MELINLLQKFDLKCNSDKDSLLVHLEALKTTVCILAPITPHICHHLWFTLVPGSKTNVMQQKWPEVDNNALATDTINLVVQVNGKLRAHINVASDADNETIERLALADSKVQPHIADCSIKKIIIVPKRLVNIVV